MGEIGIFLLRGMGVDGAGVVLPVMGVEGGVEGGETGV